MATPKVGQRDSQGRYWTGSSWKSLSDVMKAQQKLPGTVGQTEKLPGVGQIKYTGPKYGWQTAATVKSRQTGATPAAQPRSNPKDSRLDSPIAGPGPQGNRVGSRPAAQPPTQRPSAPSPARPAASVTRPAPAAPVTTARPATARPAPTRSVSGQTGDRTKDLTTWALANKAMIDKVGTKSQREILRAAQSGGSVSMPAPRPLTTKEEKMDAFDLVLEYLTSTGHVETLDEALYVMMEMDGETIKSIIEGSGVVTGAAKAINTVLKPINQTPEQEKKAVGSITKGLDVVAKPIKSILSPVDNSPKAQQLRMNKYRTIN